MAQASSVWEGEAQALTVCHEDEDVPERINESPSNPSFVRCICGVGKRQGSSSDTCRVCDQSAAATAQITSFINRSRLRFAALRSCTSKARLSKLQIYLVPCQKRRITTCSGSSRALLPLRSTRMQCLQGCGRGSLGQPGAAVFLGQPGAANVAQASSYFQQMTFGRFHSHSLRNNAN